MKKNSIRRWIGLSFVGILILSVAMSAVANYHEAYADAMRDTAAKADLFSALVTQLMNHEWNLDDPELETALNALPAEVKTLVFDCTGLEYISSAGLRLLVAAHKKMDGAMTLRAVSDEVMSVIKMTGLDRRLKIE